MIQSRILPERAAILFHAPYSHLFDSTDVDLRSVKPEIPVLSSSDDDEPPYVCFYLYPLLTLIGRVANVAPVSVRISAT